MGRLVRHYALAGFQSEIQVRYHPPEGREGDIPGFENVADLHRLPAKGATVVALPVKIKDGSGGPLRIVALVP